ncbi:MAG TPA: hypothetical protein VGE21_01185 [Flavobacteriales bacterium]
MRSWLTGVLFGLVLPVTGHAQVPALDTAAIPVGTGAVILIDTTWFPLRSTDTLTTSLYRGPGRQNRLPLLSADDRARLLQEQAPLFADADLYFQALLEERPDAMRITVLDVRGDDHDVLWLSYDGAGRLDGLDTLITSWGDGQLSVDERTYLDRHGSRLVEHTSRETVRDGNDTMAYRMDTLLFESIGEGSYVLLPGTEEPVMQRSLGRRDRDLTNRWQVQFPTAHPEKEQRRSLRTLIPAGRTVFQAASGDLNEDGAHDFAFILQDDPEGERDLLVIFAVQDARGFAQEVFAEHFFPERSSGGFHDPIGETGLSGISIENGQLLVKYFGGSAWKWESRSTYTYSDSLGGFYLTEERSRNYHAPTLHTLDEELASFEDRLSSGEKLNAEEAERLDRLRQAAKDATYKVVTFTMGERALEQR